MSDYHQRFRDRFTIEFDNADERWSVFPPQVKPEDILAFIDEIMPTERAKASDLAFDRGQRWERAALIEKVEGMKERTPFELKQQNGTTGYQNALNHLLIYLRG